MQRRPQKKECGVVNVKRHGSQKGSTSIFEKKRNKTFREGEKQFEEREEGSLFLKI